MLDMYYGADQAAVPNRQTVGIVKKQKARYQRRGISVPDERGVISVRVCMDTQVVDSNTYRVIQERRETK